MNNKYLQEVKSVILIYGYFFFRHRMYNKNFFVKYVEMIDILLEI